MKIGLQGWELPTQRTMDTIAAGGVRNYRVVFDWFAIRPTKAGNHWTAYDGVMERAARARVRILPVLLGCAAPFCRGRLLPPRTGRARWGWHWFVRSVVRRYGRDGTFWTQHPELRPMPIVAYQVWNEPNFRGYWHGRTDPASYVRFVKTTRRALRRDDPRARIVLAALAETRHGMSVDEYLRGIYRVPGAMAHFDVVALNAFARTSAAAIGGVRRVRAIMDAHGDRWTRIWVTEIGWATGGPASPLRVTHSRQASLVRVFLRTLRARSRRARIGAVYVFVVQDRRRRIGEGNWFGPYTGLFSVTGQPKRAWYAFTKLTGGTADVRLDPAPPPIQRRVTSRAAR